LDKYLPLEMTQYVFIFSFRTFAVNVAKMITQALNEHFKAFVAHRENH